MSLGSFLREFGIVLPGFHPAVAAGHHKELLNRAGFHSVRHLIGKRQHLIVGKSAYNAAGLNLLGRGQGFRQGDDLRKVLSTAGVRLDMPAARIPRRAGGKDTITDFFAAGRHDTVGGEQDGPPEGFKLRRLLPPRVAVIAREVRVLFKRRIIVRQAAFRKWVYTSTPVPCVCCRSCSRSVRSCPEIRIAGFSRTPISTLVISGLPYLAVFAPSKSAMAFTPYSPVFHRQRHQRVG